MGIFFTIVSKLRLRTITTFLALISCLSAQERFTISNHKQTAELTAFEKKILSAIVNDRPDLLVAMSKEHLRFSFQESGYFRKRSKAAKKFAAKEGNYYGYIFSKSALEPKLRTQLKNFKPFVLAIKRTSDIEITRNKKYDDFAFELSGCTYTIDYSCKSGCQLQSFTLHDQTIGVTSCFK